MIKERTFSGAIQGLEFGSKFIVITIAGTKPHVDIATRVAFEVTRREERRITAVETVIRIDEEAPQFTTYTSREDAPLRKGP